MWLNNTTAELRTHGGVLMTRMRLRLFARQWCGIRRCSRNNR